MRDRRQGHISVLPNRFLTAFLAMAMSPCLHAVTDREDLSGAQVDAVWTYDIYRNDSHIGTHRVARKGVDDAYAVEARTRISISLLGFEIYRFHYDAREYWDTLGLVALEVSVNDDGENFKMTGNRQGSRFQWVSGQTSRSSIMPVFPTNHWNPDVLEQGSVLNTLTGNINRVDISEQGKELLQLGEQSLPAIRYRYDGQLQLESWYGLSGQWLAMRFEADDGATIEYRCRNCLEGSTGP